MLSTVSRVCRPGVDSLGSAVRTGPCARTGRRPGPPSRAPGARPGRRRTRHRRATPDGGPLRRVVRGHHRPRLTAVHRRPPRTGRGGRVPGAAGADRSGRPGLPQRGRPRPRRRQRRDAPRRHRERTRPVPAIPRGAQALASGHSRHEIARLLTLSQHTVDDQGKHVCTKAGRAKPLRADLPAVLRPAHAPGSTTTSRSGSTGWFLR